MKLFWKPELPQERSSANSPHQMHAQSWLCWGWLCPRLTPHLFLFAGDPVQMQTKTRTGL